VVRMASGFLEFSREDSARLEEIRYELGKIGTNVNQIALAANRGRVPMVKAQWASVDELRRSLPMVAKALSQVIAERRRQGVALFRKFVEAQEGARQGSAWVASDRACRGRSRGDQLPASAAGRGEGGQFFAQARVQFLDPGEPVVAVFSGVERGSAEKDR